MSLTVKELLDRLCAMPAGDIQHAGRLLRGEHRSAAGEIAWWNATLRVERLIRRHHQRLAAATAAAAAGRAVKHAAAHAGLSLDDPDVIATARAASDAASALVVGASALAEATYFIERLGRSWLGTLSPATVVAA